MTATSALLPTPPDSLLGPFLIRAARGFLASAGKDAPPRLKHLTVRTLPAPHQPRLGMLTSLVYRSHWLTHGTENGPAAVIEATAAALIPGTPLWELVTAGRNKPGTSIPTRHVAGAVLMSNAWGVESAIGSANDDMAIALARQRRLEEHAERAELATAHYAGSDGVFAHATVNVATGAADVHVLRPGDKDHGTLEGPAETAMRIYVKRLAAVQAHHAAHGDAGR